MAAGSAGAGSGVAESGEESIRRRDDMLSSTTYRLVPLREAWVEAMKERKLPLEFSEACRPDSDSGLLRLVCRRA